MTPAVSCIPAVPSRFAWFRRTFDEQGPTPPGDPPTALDDFLQGPPALEPAGTPDFCERLEQWVREEVGL
ncbi:MAG: hypothetical protein EA424_00205 [Planctomycetaceae bacterium]|nr:MAG: hypothetical protein EA424_00205 [Planctomycetaceae bacterium]